MYLCINKLQKQIRKTFWIKSAVKPVSEVSRLDHRDVEIDWSCFAAVEHPVECGHFLDRCPDRRACQLNGLNNESSRVHGLSFSRRLTENFLQLTSIGGVRGRLVARFVGGWGLFGVVFWSWGVGWRGRRQTWFDFSVMKFLSDQIAEFRNARKVLDSCSTG